MFMFNNRREVGYCTIMITFLLFSKAAINIRIEIVRL